LKGVTDATMAVDEVPPSDDAAGERSGEDASEPEDSTPPPPLGAPLPPPTVEADPDPEPVSEPVVSDPVNTQAPPVIQPAYDSDAVNLEELTDPPAEAMATTQMAAQTGVRGASSPDPAITTPLTIVPATDPYGATTDEIPEMFDGVDEFGAYPLPRERFKIRLTFLAGLFAVVAVAMAAVADMVDIFTSIPVDGIAQGTLVLDSFGSNLATAAYVGAAVMVVGGLFACFGFRWGAGLAGGAGLALAGWSLIVLGLAEAPIETATSITRNPTTADPFTLTITRDIGYWLIVGIGGLGLAGFLSSFGQSGRGGRRSLNPWVAALAAVAVLVFAVGPLIPVNGATLADNFGATDIFRIPTNDTDSVVPMLYLIGRQAQLGLIALAGVVGLLLVRTWGIGLAAGSISVGLWMWISSLGELGDNPAGLAVANVFAPDTIPHGVTSVGAGLTFVLVLVAAIMAASHPVRRR
jgi:hypothetical protein